MNAILNLALVITILLLPKIFWELGQAFKSWQWERTLKKANIRKL